MIDPQCCPRILHCHHNAAPFDARFEQRRRWLNWFPSRLRQSGDELGPHAGWRFQALPTARPHECNNHD